jgi:3-dehydroquinate synthase
VHRIAVPLVGNPYQVCVGTGALEQLPALLSQTCPAARYAIIADSTVAGLYGDRVRTLANTVAPADVFPFPAGEWNKTREQWQALTDAMLAAGVGRDGAVIALGGGVTGDLAGFVAATYLRGIPFAQLPTTVLAMVDSSIGGKTGVDTAHGKNLVGAFHQPRVVVADIGLLATLPDIHLRAGLAEAVKHGAIADREHFAQIEKRHAALLDRDLEELTAIVGRSVAIKADVVARDEKERGRRATLNFGHTVGHALEAVSGYTLLHGEAVGLGMVVEARLGEAAGVTERGTAAAIERALIGLALPVETTDITPAQVLHAMELDKKSRAGTVKFAFLKRLGQAAEAGDGSWTFGASAELITDALTHRSGSHSA